jgi:rRNA-processing protein FCF1
MKVLLDTNFLITCLKQKVDFVEQIRDMKLDLAVPKEVIAELKRVSTDKKNKLKDREGAKTALHLILKEKFELVELGERYVDYGLIKFSKKNPDFAVATLDLRLAGKVKNVITLKGKSKVDFM